MADEKRKELAYLGLERLLAALNDAIESTFDEYAVGKINYSDMYDIINNYINLFSSIKEHLVNGDFPRRYIEEVAQTIQSLENFIENDLKLQIRTDLRSKYDYESEDWRGFGSEIEELKFEELESDFEEEDLE